MIENYIDSVEEVLLYVYAGGQRVSADQTPTATAVNADTGDTVQLNPVEVVDSTEGYDYYTVSLATSEISTAKKVLLTWEYVYNTETYTSNEVIDVIAPYFTADDLWEQYPEFASDGANPKTMKEIQQIERKVRMRIDTYCNQQFQNFGEQTVMHLGNGSNTLQLKRPAYRLEKVFTDGLVLFDRDVNGDVTEELVEFNIDYPHLLRKRSYMPPVYDYYQEDPVLDGLNKTRSIFKDNRPYFVTAKYGWRYVPSEVNQAAVLLGYDMLQPEDRYRMRNIINLRSADYRMEYGADQHSTTGNVDADKLLQRYNWSGVYVL